MRFNRITVKDVKSGKVVFDNKLKRQEIGEKKMFERMFHNDFSEVKQLQLNVIGNIEEISREEKNSSRF